MRIYKNRTIDKGNLYNIFLDLTINIFLSLRMFGILTKDLDTHFRNPLKIENKRLVIPQLKKMFYIIFTLTGDFTPGSSSAEVGDSFSAASIRKAALQVSIFIFIRGGFKVRRTPV